MTNKANKGFVFSAYDKFFRFLLMDNRLFLSIYIGILSFKGYFEKYLESIYSAIRYTSSSEFAISLFVNVIHIFLYPGTNTTYLSNAVNNYFGCNFKRLINSYRVVRAKELLDGKDCPVSELFSRCGFTSKSVFYVAFRKVVGMTPLQYISQNRNPFMIQRN